MRTLTQRGEVTCPGWRACVESRLQRQGSQAAETPKPPRSPPLHAAGHPHPPGRGVQKAASGRHSYLLPGPPRFAVGPYDPRVSGTPASRLPSPLLFPAGRLGQGGPQPKPGREDGAGEFCRRQPRWGAGAGNGWGKGPRGAATRHSRVELVVHPLTAAVATASRSDFRSARSPPA